MVWQRGFHTDRQIILVFFDPYWLIFEPDHNPIAALFKQ